METLSMWRQVMHKVCVDMFFLEIAMNELELV